VRFVLVLRARRLATHNAEKLPNGINADFEDLKKMLNFVKSLAKNL
jgi:hypothetical protein